MKIGNKSDIVDRFGDLKYRKMKEWGYDAVDYRMVYTETPLFAMEEEEFKKYLEHERTLMDEAGIEPTQVHGPWRWPPRDYEEEDRKERLDKMKKSVRGTSYLGCKYVVIHPLMPFGIEDIGTGNEEKTWQINAEFFKELLKEAKEYGVTVCLENMPMLKFSIATPEKILEFVNYINDDNFKICLDTGHAICFPDKTASDAVRVLGKDMKVLHCHDNMGKGDAHMLPNFGILNWKDFVKTLKEVGFDGAFSLECNVPTKLSDEMYEYMSKGLVKMAQEIVNS